MESSSEGKDWFLFLHSQHLVECLTHSNRLIEFGGREGRKKGGKEEGRERESYMKINPLAAYSTTERRENQEARRTGQEERDDWNEEWSLVIFYESLGVCELDSQVCSTAARK